jgi:hypothetical protein
MILVTLSPKIATLGDTKITISLALPIFLNLIVSCHAQLIYGVK